MSAFSKQDIVNGLLRMVEMMRKEAEEEGKKEGKKDDRPVVSPTLVMPSISVVPTSVSHLVSPSIPSLDLSTPVHTYTLEELVTIHREATRPTKQTDMYDLYTLENMDKIPIDPRITTDYPLFGSNKNKPIEVVDLCKYKSYIVAKRPVIDEILKFNEGKVGMGIFVAGGSAGLPMFSQNLDKYECRKTDIDVFMWMDAEKLAGLSSKDASEQKKSSDLLMNFTLDICGHIENLIKNPIWYSAQPGLVTFISYDYPKIQLILRPYESISSCLHGFDLGSSSIGYDGKNVYVSTMGMIAYRYGINYVDLSRRSLTFGRRLVKYMWRGFMMLLPQLDMLKIKSSMLKSRQFLGLDTKDFRVYGSISKDRPNMLNVECAHAFNRGAKSDYDEVDLFADPRRRTLSITESFRRGKKEIECYRSYCIKYDGVSYFPRKRSFRVGRKDLIEHRWTLKGIMSYILNKDTYNKNLAIALHVELSDKLAGHSARIAFPLELYEKVLQYSEKDVNEVIVAVTRQKGIPSGSKIEKEIVQLRDVALKVIPDRGWWIVQDPSRQYTSSIHPELVTPAEWYGDYLKGSS
jgi:hypothetical protein